MKRLHKLIISELLLNLLIISLGLFITVFVFDLFEHSEDIFGLPLMKMIKFILFRIPFLFSYILIFSITLSALFSVNSLSHRYELIALFSSNITLKRIFTILLITLSFLTTLSFLNESIIAPLCYRESLIIIGKIPDKRELVVENVSLKRDHTFLFIDAIDEGGSLLTGVSKIELDENNGIKYFYYIPTAIKRDNYWVAEKGYKGDNSGNKEVLSGKLEISINDAVINLGYKPNLLSLKDLLNLIDLGKKHNINTAKYINTLSKRAWHLFVPLIIFTIFLPLSIKLRDDRARIQLFVKIVGFLILYHILEANVYNYAIGSKLNALMPMIIIFSFLALVGLYNWKRGY